MKKQQFRWIISLMALATLAVVGLQGYIWNQSIQKERKKFRALVQHSVFMATEDILQPWQSSVVFLDDHFFGIHRDSLDRTATFQVDLLDSTYAGVFLRQRDQGWAFRDTTTNHFVLRDHPPRGVRGVAEQLHMIALPDSVETRISLRLDPGCPSCLRPSLTTLADTFNELSMLSCSRLERNA